MKNKSLAALCVILLLLVILLGTVIGSLYALENYVLVGWHLYPKEATFLDLRDRELSAEDYDVLVWRLPECKVLWSVPFQGQRIPCDAESVTVTELTDADIGTLLYFTELKTVHAEECTDYPRLMALQAKLPGCRVLYNVQLGKNTYDQDAVRVEVPDLNEEQAALLAWLPKLTQIDATGCEDYPLLIGLQKDHPEWNLSYTVPFGNQEVNSLTVELELENADYSDLTKGLAGMSKLQTLTLINPAASGEELVKLREEYPDIAIHWQIEWNELTLTDDMTEVDISAQPLESIAQAKELAAYFPDLQKLIVESKGIPNADMADFREEMRDSYKVVWTIYFSSKCRARTDDTYFIPIKQGEYYFKESYIHDLRYCEDMVAIDLGHHPVMTIEFVQYMPHLKYLVLAHTQVRDISPISACKELVFLELDWSLVTDYTPLLGCTALEDLNLGLTYGDSTPICQMTWLKNLWWLDRGASVQLRVQEALPDTKLMFSGNATVANGWRDLPNYYGMRDALDMYYMSW